ncbi:MAG: DNA polymerase IV [Bacteroidetes bacterium]|nr:DNA polymerase IV [Bacteroidota bacterium]
MNPAYDLNRNVHRITLYNTIAADQQHRSMRPRLYLHLDMNCFYAQVEQVSYGLFGMPVIVGGWRKEDGTPRGIVATSSYEARKLGIKTAMSAFEATQICPYILFMQVHYEKYQAISRDIRAILERYAPDVEGYSMDEFFLDITFMLKRPRKETEDMAMRLKNEVYGSTGLLCSVGVSYSKTYAKLASDLHKPNGLTCIFDEEQARERLHGLPLKEVWGIGSRRYAKLQSRGLQTIGDAIDRGKGVFVDLFGAYFGKMLYETVSGQDRARVSDNSLHTPKEVSYMHTFSDWTDDPVAVEGEITKAVSQLCYRMRGYHRKAVKYAGYIRFQDVDWKGISFVFNTPGYTNLDDYVQESCVQVAMPLLHKFLREGHKIRGIGLHTIELNEGNQTDLFFREDEKIAGLYQAIDHINNRFGLDTILPAAKQHDVKGHTHFFDRNV